MINELRLREKIQQEQQKKQEDSGSLQVKALTDLDK